MQPSFRPSAGEDAQLHEVIAASIEIYEEWELVQAALRAGEVPEAEQEAALAYQEGILRSLEILNGTTGITLESMAPEAREALGDSPADDSRLSDDDEQEDPECPECGQERIHEMGRDGLFCPDCDA